jgi:hypothetical protein
VVRKIFRRKVAARQLNVSASALRRQWAQGKASAAAENSERHLGCVIPAARLPWAAPLAKRMARDNRVRALINPAGRRELECLLLQSMARDSRSMERKSPKKEHLHQGHNNYSGAIFTAAPEKNSGAAFLSECEVRVYPKSFGKRFAPKVPSQHEPGEPPQKFRVGLNKP